MENRKRALGMGLEQLFNNENLDLERIYEYTKDLKPTNPHAVKAIYIKEIEALNGR